MPSICLFSYSCSFSCCTILTLMTHRKRREKVNKLSGAHWNFRRYPSALVMPHNFFWVDDILQTSQHALQDFPFCETRSPHSFPQMVRGHLGRRQPAVNNIVFGDIEQSCCSAQILVCVSELSSGICRTD